MTLVGGSAPFTYSWAYKAPTSPAFKAIAAGGTSIGKVNLVPVPGRPSLSITGTKGNLNGLQGYVMQLTVTDRNGLSTSATTLMDGSCAFGSGARLGVEPQVGSLQVRLFPNPVVETLEVEVRGLASPARVALYDIEGRVQQQWSLLPVEGVGTLRANIATLGAGLYILGIETSQGVIHRQRVLKQR
jgi:hypothetical protein